MAWIDEVEKVFQKYNIPKHIWYPIMLEESGGNPAARNISAKEESVGLFQINLKAHPEYRKLDLTDPVTNAEIAARDFIAPAWKWAKAIPDPGLQAQSVWKSGIKPNWPSVVKTGKDLEIQNIARNIYKNQDEYKMPEDILREAGKENILDPIVNWGKENILGPAAQGILIIILLILAVFSFYQVFRPEINQITGFYKNVKKVVS